MNIAAKKSEINILDIIEKSGVLMEKHGLNWFGLCPFHSEKTASFSVNDQKQIFYCFGCAAGGDVIEYVMKFYKLDFPETLKFLGLDGEEQESSKARIAAKKYRHQQKRKAKAERLQKQVIDFCDGFYRQCWETAAIIENALKKLSTEQVFELSDLVKWLSTRQLWIHVIEDAYEAEDMEKLYQVWRLNS